MLDLNILKKSGFFKEVNLKKGDFVFKEGEIDNNVYIVLHGELSVEKNINKNETKILSYLTNNDIFGEGSINATKEKPVSIRSTRTTSLLFINATKGINDFIDVYKKEGLDFLKYIIYLSNKRLSESNNLITSNYKISKEIIKMDSFKNKSIFELIERYKKILNVDDIVYYEQNTILENYLVLKYDTRQTGKMQDEIIEITDSKLDLLGLKVSNINSYIQKLEIGNKSYGFLVFFKKNSKFEINDKKTLVIASTSFAGIVKHKKNIEEENNKKYIEGSI